jgi:hypothetical protein
MPVAFDKFVDWAEKHFGPVEVRGNEICVNSIFTDDKKKKLWCNPFGGKNKVRYGVYHCWKTDKKGTLLSLVMQLEKCGRDRALDILGCEKETLLVPDDIDFSFDINAPKKELDLGFKQKELVLPPFTYPISVAPTSWHERASEYLRERCLPSKDFFVCTGGKYEGRVIIPYYDGAGRLVYFNGRSITGNPLRYRGPEKEIGVGKEDVIYFPQYPSAGDTVFLCEGEFDAYALFLCGYKACACGGKFLSDKQAVILSSFKMIVALDADEAGTNSLSIMHNRIVQYNQFASADIVQPPKQVKDWNEFYKQYGAEIIKGYIASNTRRFTL